MNEQSTAAPPTIFCNDSQNKRTKLEYGLDTDNEKTSSQQKDCHVFAEDGDLMLYFGEARPMQVHSVFLKQLSSDFAAKITTESKVVENASHTGPTRRLELPQPSKMVYWLLCKILHGRCDSICNVGPSLFSQLAILANEYKFAPRLLFAAEYYFHNRKVTNTVTDNWQLFVAAYYLGINGWSQTFADDLPTSHKSSFLSLATKIPDTAVGVRLCYALEEKRTQDARLLFTVPKGAICIDCFKATETSFQPRQGCSSCRIKEQAKPLPAFASTEFPQQTHQNGTSVISPAKTPTPTAASTSQASGPQVAQQRHNAFETWGRKSKNTQASTAAHGANSSTPSTPSPVSVTGNAQRPNVPTPPARAATTNAFSALNQVQSTSLVDGANHQKVGKRGRGSGGGW